ncbi:glycosyltransferase family 2 protein [Chloroflexota bacterium]
MQKVSIVVPSYERIELLAEAVQSVLAQTYTDFEIIIVDDGSTEPIASHLGIDDQRICYIRQENRGPAAARNRGIDFARGYYIAFLDSDDLFLPTKLEKQVACMEKNPDILLSHTSYQRINAGGEYIEEIRSGAFSGRVYPQIISCCPIATPTVMIRRQGSTKTIRFEESIRIGEDVILWTQIARKSTILGIDEPLTKVRIHANSAAINPQAQITGLMNIMNYSIKENSDLSLILRRKLLSSNYFIIAYNYFRLWEKFQFLRFLVLAIITWPLNHRIYAFLFRLSLSVIYNSLFREKEK